MEYQVLFKQYKNSIPVKEECWKLDPAKIEQWKDLEQFPCRIQCIRKDEANGQYFFLRAQLIHHLEQPVSMSLEFVPEEWSRREYVFMPGAVYDGNRMDSQRISYPPFHAGRTKEEWDQVITDIPHLDKDGNDSRIQFRSGDMSTPAMGYFDGEQEEGFLIFANQMEHGRYTGFTVSEKVEQTAFRVSCPAVREEKKYFFGELMDGTGFYPTCEAFSDDVGVVLREGERMEMQVRCCHFKALNLHEYFTKFNELREVMECGQEFASIPFSKAYAEVKEKYKKMNFDNEGYYRVGTEPDSPPSYWQAGWVGGGMNSYSFLLEDQGEAHRQAVSSLKFITEHLQDENGWYFPMYANGQKYGDDFLNKDSTVLLVRKDVDLLYFLLKQVFFLKSHEELTEHIESSIARQADAVVRFYKKNGQLGQFIDTQQETLVEGDTASAAIAPGALSLAYEYFGNIDYLETAESLGELYWEKYLKKGLMNGGPGEICQASDSESAFGFLESCVQLYETTGKEKWLQASKEAFELAITWVMSYDFCFPKRSTAGKLKAHTRGTVFANAQNKHSAPGICTLSGNSMLKLYRFTGDKKYLKWMSRISHALAQFVSLPERPIDSLAGYELPPGYFNERVQTSDWEGKETIGEFLNGSNWPEVSMLLTYVEIPGIYLDLDRKVIQCSDHLNAEIIKEDESQILLGVSNPTVFDASVTIMIDHSQDARAIGHLYFANMERAEVEAGGERIIRVKKEKEKGEYQMTKKERVWAAIRHQESDRVPKGELYIQPQIANKLLGKNYPTDHQHFERDKEVRELLHMDIINVGDWPEREIGRTKEGKKIVQSVYGQTFLVGEESKRLLNPPVDIEDAIDYQEPDITMVTGAMIERYVKETDFFVFAQVGGPISMLNEMYPMEDYMVNCITYPEETHILSEKVIAFEIKKAKLFIDKGADAILIADDMAFNTGVFLPPFVMEKNVYPFYKQMIQEIKAYKDVPIFLHSDGNLNSVLDHLVECGFDGIQSLQPSAGMDICEVKEKYGDRLCLWGNIDLDYIMCFGTVEEVRADVRRTIEIASPGGGFILSTCNTMVDIIPPINILTMIEEADI